MSKGIGGSAKVVSQNENTVVYEYCAYNLNHEEYRNPKHIYDGIITIDKRSLVEPEIYQNLRKQPNGRKKLITKRIPREVDYSLLIATNKIIVENSKFCWQIFNNGVGLIAIHIIFKIFSLYQSEGSIPETVGYHV